MAMDKSKDAAQTDPGGSSVGSEAEELAMYKREVRQLRGKIQGYQTLSSLLQESKQEIKELRASNTELLQRIDILVSNPLSNTASQTGPSSLLQSPQSVNSLTEEKRIISGEGNTAQQRISGHASVASENSELSDMEIVQQEDVNINLNDQHQISQTQDVPQSLEIDPYDLHAGMEGATGGMVNIVALDPENPFSMKDMTKSRTASSSTPADLSESIVLISPEETQRQHGPLVNQVRQISEVLTRNVGLNSPSELSDALARLSIDVLKVEKELRMKQVMINNLCPENEQLKSKLEATIEARDESIKHLKREKKDLQEKNIELEKRLRSAKTPVASPQDWVHVGDPHTTEEVSKLNDHWEKQTRDLESLHTTEINQLQIHLEDARERLRKTEAAFAQRQEENDKLLNKTKTRVEEERKSKDVAMQHFYREQARRHQCETDLIAERRRTATLSDRVAALEAQLAVFQDTQFTSNNLSPEETLSSLAALSPEELRTQVQILKQQASIYKEDFDRERQDRERVQADKDVIQSGLTRYKTDLVAAQRKIRELEQEQDLLKSENACLRQEFQQIRQSEQDVVRLQSENIQLREQLQQKINEVLRITGTQRLPTPQNSYTRDPPNLTGETWRCSSCTYDNPGVRSTCEVCGRSKRTSRSPTPSRQAPRLIPHTSGPTYGWTECDTTMGHNRVTSGDDLIIDQGEDMPDTSRN